MNRKKISIDLSPQPTAPLTNKGAWFVNWCSQLRQQPIQRWQRQLLISLAGVVLGLALVNLPAQAAAITADGATCTLVDAITAANTDTATGGCAAGSGADTITLGASVALTVANNGYNGLPVINTVITLEGTGHKIERTTGDFRLLEVAAGGYLTLNQSTITGGNTSDPYGGGGIYISEGGTLTVTNSTISSNTIAAGISGSTGGGISNYGGTLTVINSTISGNTATGGIMGGRGGGIYNSTFNSSPATITLINSTLTGNTTSGIGFTGGGGIMAYNGTVTLVRTLVAGNIGTNPEIYNYVGTVNGNNYNLIGYNNDAGASGFTPSGTDIIPLTGLATILETTLADNGGGTFTHALVGGSPALNAATDSGLATDQRGMARPQGTADDIGAFELAPEARINGTNCALADAITAANTDTATNDCAAGTGADTITLLRNITLTVANNGDNGLPIISSPITLEGVGYTIARNPAAGAFRILTINASGDLTLNAATIKGGLVTGFGTGAGINSAGTLQINNSTIMGNVAGIAGGIDASGTTTMTNSTISGNSTTAFGAGGFGNSGTMTLFNTTVTNNIAANLGGGFDNSGILTLNRSIISGNSAGSWREFRAGGTVNADNYNLFGYNGSSGADGFTPGGTDIVPTVPLASVLNIIIGDNGGPSFVHALVAGSPAIDAANDSGLATDQRGVVRPQGPADDIGAFEAATLLAMVTDIDPLTPSFDPNILSYTATVGNAISSVSIAPTVSEITASTVVTVTPAGGSPVTCTGNPATCPLTIGDNLVEVHVTSPDGTIVRTYSLIVTRAGSPDATLSDLTIGVGTLTPSFDPNTTSYTAIVSSTISSVNITPTVNEINATTVVTVTPPGGAPITCTGSPIDCPLAIGDNLVVVTVTAQDGSIKTYTTIITRPSTDATLSALAIGVGTLTPSFATNTTSYTATVNNATNSVSVTLGTNEGNANTVVTVTPPGGTPITCTGNPVDCPLAVGDNVIEVTVTAQDGITTQTYTLIITREPLDTDGDGIPDSLDQDADGDGIPNSVEGNGTVDTDGDGVPDSLDLDSDNDGINDVREAGGLIDTDGDGKADGTIDGNGIIGTPANNPVDSDGDGTPNYLDLDSDADVNFDLTESGIGGLIDANHDGMLDGPDTDGDGIMDSADGNPTGIGDNGDPDLTDTDDDGIPDAFDNDSDNDGKSDLSEGTGDSDGDGILNYVDSNDNDGPLGDLDGDGLNNTQEAAIGTSPTNADSDGDGIPDGVEVGPNPASPLDTDGDGTPNVFDADSDNDGKTDLSEGVGDADGDGILNYVDANDNDGPLGDLDGDGVPNGREGGSDVDTDGDGIPNYLDADDDGDGIFTKDEDLNKDGDPTNDDTDGDGIPNYRDDDDNGNGILTKDEDTNHDGNLNNDDSNGNGIPDYLDTVAKTHIYWFPIVGKTTK